MGRPKRKTTSPPPAWKQKYPHLGQDPEQIRAKNLRRDYNLTVEDYDRLEESQEGVCAICHLPETSLSRWGTVKRLAVDHDHTTGLVRGLLCTNCNRGLGLLGESNLLEASEYLARHAGVRLGGDILMTTITAIHAR